MLTITPSLATPNASQSVTWTATLTSSTGATVPFMDRFGWDLNGDGLVDHVESAPSVTYPEGSYTAFLEVRTSDNRAVTATRFITVAPAPVLSATLQAAPSSADFATSVNFTASVSSVGATGPVTSYGWDFTNDGTIDSTTPGNTAAKHLQRRYARREDRARGRDVSQRTDGHGDDHRHRLRAGDGGWTRGQRPAGSWPAARCTITATVTSTGTGPTASRLR